MDIAHDLDRLRDEEAELELQLAALRAKRVALEKRVRPARQESTRPIRDLVADMLDEAATPLNSLMLAGIIRPLHGRTVPATRFGTLSNDEAKSYDSSRVRPVYLCHCLTHDQGRAVKRFWARSDWPLADRIVGPMSGRILFLRGAAWAIDLARRVEAGELIAEQPEVLQYVAADQARDAGLSVRRGEFPYDEWLKAISGALDRHSDHDRVLREKAALELAARLNDRELLFGSRNGLVSLPGSSPSWRSAIDER
ncbi:hypothetical protein HMF7854_04255 [Sphingomonas ginkgonis]|uniref:Uncharacterized protein n=1 Tax=Sphingomonas ginkgonis TaxID=2315330 RepID=A0A3R9WP86_9SPHN|nr:hypothetical protein [Sphingomonas ginkgonis]RST30123.1 hypothetical protein HMF7854_04255 [Sphingomonas ginkgonis]